LAVSGKKVYSRSSSGAIWLWRYGVPGQWRQLTEKDCTRIGVMNYKGDLICQFSTDKVMIWNQDTSVWTDHQGEAFFINLRNNVEWYKDGTFTEVASEVEHMAYCAEKSVAFVTKIDNKSVWAWDYGTA